MKEEMNNMNEELYDCGIMNEKLDTDINDNSILLLEMAGRIPGEIFVDKKGKRRLIIAVGSNETRGVAHFHVFRNKVDWRNWKNGACLMFKKNKYFDHKDNSETLTKDELEVVMKCLKVNRLQTLLVKITGNF